ncbi:hypothetical protein GOODEAATRI_003339 [Goodea atripinnis]|uniref:Uncharacterized protein n=1 Tax=Goodea atripinnis TaxID=208336 RepID=A0ABV0N7L9_9TELE
MHFSVCFNLMFADVKMKSHHLFFFYLRFPEIRYFQNEDVRTKLTDILFCYARENEHLLYKQDAGPSVAVVTKVNRIQDQLVKKHDIELHMHLNRLEIAPQIYGIVEAMSSPAPVSAQSDLLDFSSSIRRRLAKASRPHAEQWVEILKQQSHIVSKKTSCCASINTSTFIPRSGSTVKAAPLNINKVSSSLLSFGRKLIAPAMTGVSSSVAPINSQTSRTVSSSPSIESLSGGRGQFTASPPLPPSRGSDVSGSSPPLSATKKESFFNITRSRSHSKSMGKRETIKDILKGALRFNQSQLEAEENEEITIADDHYTSTAAASETPLISMHQHGEPHQGADSRRSRDSYLDGSASTDEKEGEEPVTTPPEQQVGLGSCKKGKNWDDYILVSQDGDLLAEGRETEGKHPLPVRRGRDAVRMEPEGSSGTFHDPLMTGTTSGSSSPEEGSTNSKDSDFTMVNPNDL